MRAIETLEPASAAAALAAQGQRRRNDPLSLSRLMDEAEALRKYEALVAAVKSAIDAADPVGLLRLGSPSEEYEPELGTIVPRVAKAVDLAAVRRIVHAEFSRWFDHECAGPPTAYSALAERIWRAVLSFRGPG
jgi:hypothetical protein